MDAFDAALLLLVDASGGDRGGIGLRGLAKADVEVNLQNLVGWPGARIAGGVEGLGGTGLDSHPAWQGLTNIDEAPFAALNELYLEQALGPVTARAGRLDSAALLGVNEHAAVFLNPSMGFNPCNYALPTYPAPALGAAARLDAGPVSVTASGFGIDIVPVAAGQAEVHWDGAPGRAGVGGWVAPGGDGRGAWALVDQELPAMGPVTPRVYATGALAVPELDGADAQAGAGLTLTGLLPSRTDDVVGIGGSWVHRPSAGNEVVVEALYQLAANDHIAFVADLQHVRGDTATGTAGTLRLVLSL